MGARRACRSGGECVERARLRLCIVFPAAFSTLVACVLFGNQARIVRFVAPPPPKLRGALASTANKAPAPATAEPEPKAEPETEPTTSPAPALVPASSASKPEPDVEEEPRAEYAPQEINDSASMFVTNAGLVFALIFSFIFGRAYGRFDDIARVFADETALLHTLVNLVRLIDLDTEAQRAVLVQLRSYAFAIRFEVTSGQTLRTASSLDDLYMVVPVIKALQVANDAANDGHKGEHGGDHVNNEGNTDATNAIQVSAARFDMTMLNSALESIQALLQARYERWSLFSRNISPRLWILLIVSANLTFFGVLLVQSSHFYMDFLMCTLTVLSMCMILFVLSDLDQFHTGGIRIDVSQIDSVFGSELPAMMVGVNAGIAKEKDIAGASSADMHLSARLRRMSEIQWGSSRDFACRMVSDFEEGTSNHSSNTSPFPMQRRQSRLLLDSSMSGMPEQDRNVPSSPNLRNITQNLMKSLAKQRRESTSSVNGPPSSFASPESVNRYAVPRIIEQKRGGAEEAPLELEVVSLDR